MRIAFVSDAFDGISGGTVTARRFVEGLRRRHEVTVVSTDPPGPGSVQVPGLRIEERAIMISTDGEIAITFASRVLISRGVV